MADWWWRSPTWAGIPPGPARDIQVQIRSSDLAVVNASETDTIQEGNISAIATLYGNHAASVGRERIRRSSPPARPACNPASLPSPCKAPLSSVPRLCTSGVDAMPASRSSRGQTRFSRITALTARWSFPPAGGISCSERHRADGSDAHLLGDRGWELHEHHVPDP